MPNEYRMLARRIRETAHATRREAGSGVVVGDLVSRLVRYYVANDPAFDRDKFLRHCGLDDSLSL